MKSKMILRREYFYGLGQTLISKGKKMDQLTINGVEYVKKTEVKDGLSYVLVRTYSAGVHVGYLKSHKGKEVVLLNSRRIWKWSGAASLSQISVDGVENKDGECKISVVVKKITLTEAIEIIPCEQNAIDSINEVKEWKA